MKSISVANLVALMSEAKRRGYSAFGRPGWVADNKDDLSAAVLMPIGVKRHDGNTAWRCYAGVVVRGRGPVVFTLDVFDGTFAVLPDVADHWEPAGLLLFESFHVPVDE